MIARSLSRRQILGGVAAGLGASLAARADAARQGGKKGTDSGDARPFPLCLNMATIRRKGLDLARQIEIAAEAGYDSVELWTGDISAYAQGGGSLDDLAKRLVDLNLTV